MENQSFNISAYTCTSSSHGFSSHNSFNLLFPNPIMADSIYSNSVNLNINFFLFILSMEKLRVHSLFENLDSERKNDGVLIYFYFFFIIPVLLLTKSSRRLKPIQIVTMEPSKTV